MRRAWWNTTAAAAGLDGLTSQEMRHTAASLAVSEGASVLGVQRLLGHDKPSTTLDFYADLFDDDLEELANKLDSARAGFATAYSSRTDDGSVVERAAHARHQAETYDRLAQVHLGAVHAAGRAAGHRPLTWGICAHTPISNAFWVMRCH